MRRMSASTSSSVLVTGLAFGMTSMLCNIMFSTTVFLSLFALSNFSIARTIRPELVWDGRSHVEGRRTFVAVRSGPYRAAFSLLTAMPAREVVMDTGTSSSLELPIEAMSSRLG